MDYLTPDFSQTLRRFPLAILLSALAAAVFVAFNDDLLTTDNEAWERATIGLMTAGAFAVAGRLFAESRDDHPWLAIFLSYVLPVLVVLLFQVRDSFYAAPFLLFPVSGLWMSIAAFTRWGGRDERDDIQNRFWWLNHRAVITGIIALAGFLLIAGGMLVIDRSLALLFNIDTSALLIDTVLPVFGLFFAPVYWLSTIPALDDFEQKDMTEPDFLSRAIGFLGQFVLTPLLLIYAAILFAYTVQILIQQQLPEGTLGWMVLFFVVAGAANWLVLHPPFMRAHKLVQLFRAYWFWLTLLPIGLYALAVWTRIGAYGLTDERMLLIAGGLWAALVTLAFLLRRFADIRLIPGIAALVLLILSVGPWNMQQAAIWDQSRRLEAALDAAGWRPDTDGTEWSAELAAQARGAFYYLSRSEGEDELRSILSARGLELASTADVSGQLERLDLPPEPAQTRRLWAYTQAASLAEPIDLSDTPVLLGQVNIGVERTGQIGAWQLSLSNGQLIATDAQGQSGSADLSVWRTRQDRLNGLVTDPVLRIDTPDRALVLIVNYASMGDGPESAYTDISAQVFTDRAD